MNVGIARTLSFVPERVSRVQSGSLFDPMSPGVCPHPERVAHLARFLEWLGPLREVTKDDLRLFGLMTDTMYLYGVARDGGSASCLAAGQG